MAVSINCLSLSSLKVLYVNYQNTNESSRESFSIKNRLNGMLNLTIGIGQSRLLTISLVWAFTVEEQCYQKGISLVPQLFGIQQALLQYYTKACRPSLVFIPFNSREAHTASSCFDMQWSLHERAQQIFEDTMPRSKWNDK